MDDLLFCACRYEQHSHDPEKPAGQVWYLRYRTIDRIAAFMPEHRNAAVRFIESHPVAMVLGCGAVLRLTAAVFSRGFGMHDDHFCVIEIAQRWVDGYGDWFGTGDHMRSIIYPGLHYAFFRILQFAGIHNPQTKMLLVRLAHALYSLATVYFGYKITAAISTRRTACTAGLLLSLFWLMPFMSVRNLIEFVCIPPLLAATYMLVRHDRPRGNSRTLAGTAIAGALFGLAFIFRFQTAVMAAAAGIVLMTQKKWVQCAALAAAFLMLTFSVQGAADWIAYGNPVETLRGYIFYNLRHAYSYTTGPWYQYITLLAGVIVAPVGLFLLWGFVRQWRAHPLMFWPSAAYFILHSLFPNKQERFILPVIPFIFIAGIAGWHEYAKNSRFWSRRKGILTWSWSWFWAVNTLLLLLFSTTYSKKARVESMSYFWNKTDVTGVILESGTNSVPMAPRFYMGKEVPLYSFPANKPLDSLDSEIARNKPAQRPNYVVMTGPEGLERRLERLGRIGGKFRMEKKITPSLLDRIMHAINPRFNVNQTTFIYRM